MASSTSTARRRIRSEPRRHVARRHRGRQRRRRREQPLGHLGPAADLALGPVELGRGVALEALKLDGGVHQQPAEQDGERSGADAQAGPPDAAVAPVSEHVQDEVVDRQDHRDRDPAACRGGPKPVAPDPADHHPGREDDHRHEGEDVGERSSCRRRRSRPTCRAPRSRKRSGSRCRRRGPTRRRADRGRPMVAASAPDGSARCQVRLISPLPADEVAKTPPPGLSPRKASSCSTIPTQREDQAGGDGAKRLVLLGAGADRHEDGRRNRTRRCDGEQHDGKTRRQRKVREQRPEVRQQGERGRRERAEQVELELRFGRAVTQRARCPRARSPRLDHP